MTPEKFLLEEIGLPFEQSFPVRVLSYLSARPEVSFEGSSLNFSDRKRSPAWLPKVKGAGFYRVYKIGIEQSKVFYIINPEDAG